MKNILPIVHLVDTEGPFREPIEETFDQLRNTFGIDLEPTKENLKKIQNGVGITTEKIDTIMRRFSKHRLTYNETWSDIEKMCETIFSEKWRREISKSSMSPYTLSWHCLDQIGYHYNPRRRQLGPNLIYEFYKNQIDKKNIYWDRLYWHYHPVSFGKELNKSGTSLNHYPFHYLSLGHRILDCKNFPAVFRPGFHIERTDLNVFLEQWIPFDYANQSSDDQREDENNRFQNWVGASREWEAYHPDFNDPRKKGNLKRSIARCLNLGTDFAKLTKNEIKNAFQRCSEGKPTILAYCGHDHRNLIHEIENVTNLIDEVSKNFKQTVNYKYCNAVDAMRIFYNMDEEEPVKLDYELIKNKLTIKCNKSIFGAQPFLTFKTHLNEIYHDNFSFGKDDSLFHYSFDSHSVPIEMLKKIGVGVNDSCGNSSVLLIDLKKGEATRNFIK